MIELNCELARYLARAFFSINGIRISKHRSNPIDLSNFNKIMLEEYGIVYVINTYHSSFDEFSVVDREKFSTFLLKFKDAKKL
jgi:hypothetical protein